MATLSLSVISSPRTVRFLTSSGRQSEESSLKRKIALARRTGNLDLVENVAEAVVQTLSE